MSSSKTDSSLSKLDYFAAILILGGAVLVLYFLLPPKIVALGAMIVTFAVGVFLFVFAAYRYDKFIPDQFSRIPFWVMFSIPSVLALIVILNFDIQFTLLNGLVFFAFILLLSVYWIVIPASLTHHLREKREREYFQDRPSITALIPAYNESGYIGPCIESFQNADYPDDKLEIIVIDDGSTDNTYEEAQTQADENVEVLYQENQGKHAALNLGLKNASTDLIVGVDADSRIADDALNELVQTYNDHSNTYAVAGNVKVSNRNSFLTKLQALEYIVSINMYRRAFDQIGLVKVVPGCLGLFEKEIVDEIGGFSGDTITEDFDLTIDLLKRGGDVHYSSKAIVRTEAPNTWQDLVSQRLRWLRGTIQTAAKHGEIFYQTRFSKLHQVIAPFLFASIGIVPFLGMVVLGTIIWMLLFGSITRLAGIISLFMFLEMLFATLALRIENTVDSESLWLVRFAPLMVFGYKQLHDMIMIRSLFDVIIGSNVDWTHATRIRQREVSEEDKPD
ncbi:MAG: glycosyltransferase [Halobacteriaceae archaeon]